MNAGFKGRREDLRLVTGQGKYTSDWNLPGQLHGSFLRSDRAHAEIVSLDMSPARATPGVVAVFTGADTARAGFKSTPQLARYPRRGGATIKVPHRDGLAQGRPTTRASAGGITGMPAERITAHAQDVGGGFGIRSDAYAEYCGSLPAAKALGRPVKCTSSRSETFLSD